jgi:hypothetical protein
LDQSKPLEKINTQFKEQPPYEAVNTGLPDQIRWKLYILSLIINDGIMTGFAFWLAYQVRFKLNLPIFQTEIVPSIPFYTRLVLVMIGVWVVFFMFLGLYRRENLLGGTKEYAAVFRGATFGLLAVIITSFLEPQFIIARGWLLLGWFLGIFGVAIGRFGLRRIVYAQRKRGKMLSPAILVGANNEGQLLVEQLWNWRTSGLYIVGVVDDGIPVGTYIYRQIQVLGDLSCLGTIIEKTNAKELIIAASALNREEILRIFKLFGFSDHVNLSLSSGLFEVVTTGLEIREMAYVPLVRVNKAQLTGMDHILKIILDYGLTIPGFILISPFLLLKDQSCSGDESWGFMGNNSMPINFAQWLSMGMKFWSIPPILRLN